MSDEWCEVSSADEVVEALGLGGVGVLSLERLLLAPQSGRYLRVESADNSSTSGGFDLRVFKSRFYFNVTACKELRGDIVVALTAFFMTNSAPVAATAAALRKLTENLKRLTPEEAEVVRAIVQACPGNPYEVPVTEAEVRVHFDGDPDAADDLLDSLQAKGVIEGRRGDRVKLVF